MHQINTKFLTTNNVSDAAVDVMADSFEHWLDDGHLTDVLNMIYNL